VSLRSRLGGFGVVLAIAGGPAYGSRVVQMSFEEAAGDADVVVVGTVVEVPEFASEESGIVVRRNRFHVEKYLRGDGAAEIEVQTIGGPFMGIRDGRPEQLVQIAGGQPQLPAVGTRAVLFLKKYGGGAYMICSASHGVVPVVQRAGTTEDVVGLSFRNPDVMPEGAAADYARARTSGPIGPDELFHDEVPLTALDGLIERVGAPLANPTRNQWGPEQDGVRTSLSASDKEFSLGKPILLRLVVENQGRRAVHFAFEQLHVHLSMSVEQSDGTNVPCVVPSGQTGFGRGVVLNRGERTVLLEGLDIADQYLLTSPGIYKFQFKGQPGYPRYRDMEGSDAIPASNAVTITVADGPVKPSRLLARALFDAVQTSGWHVALLGEGDVVPAGRSSVSGTALALGRDRPTSMADALVALIWVTASPSAIVPPKPDEKSGSPAEAIGRCPWGEVYLRSASASPAELETVRKLTATALNIDGR